MEVKFIKLQCESSTLELNSSNRKIQKAHSQNHKILIKMQQNLYKAK